MSNGDRQEFYVVNQYLPLLLQGTVSNEGERPSRKLIARMQGDGTLRYWGIEVGQDADGRERPILVEADRTARSQVVLWDYVGAGQIRGAGEPTTGEFRTIPHGKDEANNIDAFRTDPNRIKWVRPHKEYIDVPSAEIDAAEGDLWDPGQADTVRYMVMFNVISDGGVAVTDVYVGREINSAGGLARPYYWMYDETIPHPGQSGWRGPYYIHGDDAVRGSAIAVNQASVHFAVWRVDVGA